MKTVTLPAGDYVIADVCAVSDSYYQEILDEWIDFGEGEWDIVGDGVFLYCTGADGEWDVKTLENESVGVVGVDAANISIIPEALAERDGVPVTFDDEFTVKVYHDSVIVGDAYRIRL